MVLKRKFFARWLGSYSMELLSPAAAYGYTLGAVTHRFMCLDLMHRALKRMPTYRQPHVARFGAWDIWRFVYDELMLLQEMCGVTTTKDRRLAVRGWVSSSLDDDDKQAIEAGAAMLDSVLLAITDLCTSGYRLSVSWDDYSSAIQAVLICTNEDDQNYALGMSARHPRADMCLATLVYKHEVLTEGNWQNHLSGGPTGTWS